jgi:arabinose-5-phosphate isomerase
VLDVSVAEEACPMNLAPTSSTTAALAMGDALAMGVLELRGLRPEDFAALHPGGALGPRSLYRVADLMHGGQTIPMVGEEAGLRRAVEEMTRERARSAAAGEALHACGMTTVVDAAGRLLGVITDGDLRRLHLRGGPFDALRAGDVATRTPRTIGADDLAAKALEMMEGSITTLVVVDDTQRPRGIIHLHDILRAKIV